jgi:hypothetical protein
VLVARLSRLLERPLDNRDDLGGQVGVEDLERFGHLLKDLVERGAERISFEGLAAAKQLVENHPGREDVGTMVGALSPHLFRRHVVQRPHHHLAAGQLRGDQPREPEVQQLRRPAGRNEDVGRLDVAVDHAVDVGVFDAFADLDRELELPCEGHRRVRGHPLLKVLSFQELHGEKRLPFMLAEVVDGDDVLVGKLAGSARLAEEPFLQFVVGFERADQLDGNHTLK